MRIYTIAQVPDELAQQWLQHLRDFDKTHEGCHFDVAADAPNLTLAEMVKLCTIDPALSFQQLFERPKTSFED